MIQHHLRELQALSRYTVVGIGAEPATLAGLVFDTKDWGIRSFVVRQNALGDEPVVIPPTWFRSLDDNRRELNFEAEGEVSASARLFDAEALSGRGQFDAVPLIGRTVGARNGPAGRIIDFLVNVDLWVLRYFIIDIDGRRVLTDIEWASGLSQDRELPRIDLPAEAVATAPPYESLVGLSVGYEEALYRHYTSASATWRDRAAST
ncbi:MAG: hypothetical protein PVH89_00820 [Gammaproteobacteria bacterium]|jgi:hypothetical protein